ncbi:MAG: HAD hydrolase-like protein [archaeon]
MEKPILATNIDGFLIDHSAFIESHRIWFDRAILLTKDNSLGQWKGHPKYFKGVNIAMEKIMPDVNKGQRTIQARTWYQEDIIHYIKLHPEIINYQLVETLKKLKQRFTLALITTNTKEHIQEILKAANLEGLYDIIHASSSDEEPDKLKVFEEFKSKYGNPKYYVASRSKEAFEACLKIGTICIYFTQNKIDPKIQKAASRTLTTFKELELLNNI